MSSVKPNAKKIDQLFSTIKTGGTDEILSACETFIVEDEFFQWEGTPQIRKQREANKLYFLENGGIGIMVDLINKTSEDLVKRFGIDVLWAYSETDDNRRELLYGGILQVVFNCLKSECAKVQEGAVGALWQLLEYEPIQNKSVEEGILEPLLNLLTVSKVTRTQTRAAGCLHLISWNETCRNDLIKAGAVEKILSIETSALMVNYFRLLALGNILLLKEHRDLLDNDTLQKAFGQIKHFITTETPEGVRSIEDRLMYIWVSMRPYIGGIYSDVKELFLLGMFAFANLTYKEDNRRLLVQEELKDKILCLGWVELEDAKPWAQTIQKNLLTNSKPPEPPTLYAIVHNYLNNQFRK